MSKKFFITILLSVVFVGLAYSTYFFYTQSRSQEKKDRKEVVAMERVIKRKVVIPEGETPVLATVTDIEALEDQEFFRDAQQGDKVVIYSDYGRAILYRPSTKQIVNMSSLILENPQF